MKLNLGCGSERMDGYVNIDISPNSKADLLHDLNEPFPLPDNSVREIYSSHVFEHLTDFPKIINECHRVLKTGGILFFIVPYRQMFLTHWDHKTPFCWISIDKTFNENTQFPVEDAGMRIPGWILQSLYLDFYTGSSRLMKPVLKIVEFFASNYPWYYEFYLSNIIPAIDMKVRLIKK